jgi:hypothetical protein
MNRWKVRSITDMGNLHFVTLRSEHGEMQLQGRTMNDIVSQCTEEQAAAIAHFGSTVALQAAPCVAEALPNGTLVPTAPHSKQRWWNQTALKA